MCSSALLPALLSLILLLLSTETLTEGSRVARAAGKCCRHAMVACCEKALEFNQQLRCTEDVEEVVRINRCIQTELFTEKSLRTANIEDSVCCDVFAYDENYEKGICAMRCKRALSTPGWSTKQKLHAIQDCKKNNAMYKCFDECLKNRRVFPGSLSIQTECTLNESMTPGKIYIDVTKRILKRI